MVFVVQEQIGKNISAASAFGEITPLLGQGSQVGFDSGNIVAELTSKLKNFCNNDFLLLMGDPVAIGMSVAIASDVNNGRVKLLKWDRQERLYIPVTIQLKKGEMNVG